jgi:hypothetical protein
MPALEETQYHTILGSSLIIDITSFAKQSLSISYSKPTRGTLSTVDSLLLKYRPAFDFKDGEDQFVLTARHNGKILATQTVTIHMKETKEEFPCGLIPVQDMVEVKPGGSASISVLDNDWFCSVHKSDFKLAIHKSPRYGQSLVDGESIHYTPGAEYNRDDEFIYSLTGSTDGRVYYGIVSVTTRLGSIRQGTFTNTQAPGGRLGRLFFVDENKGYIGTTKGLFKTINGGNSWSQIHNGEDYNLFFLDEDKGFTGYGWGNFMTTDNGGTTWKEFAPFEGPVQSIFFTSRSTGYIGLYTGGDLAGVASVVILKTEDGGETWRQVLAPDPTAYGYIEIKFVDANTGYAILSNQLFRTTDAGETWNVISTEEFYYFTVTSENDLFAISPLRQEIIITSHNGGAWQPVAYFPKPVWGIGFSPSSEMGVGVMYHSQHHLAISRTYDNGTTWTDPENFNMDNFNFLRVYVASNSVAYLHFYDPLSSLDDRIVKYSID